MLGFVLITIYRSVCVPFRVFEKMPPLIYRQADFEIHRDFRDEYEDDDLGDGNIFPNQTPYAPHEMVDDGPAPPIIVVVQGPPNVSNTIYNFFFFFSD